LVLVVGVVWLAWPALAELVAVVRDRDRMLSFVEQFGIWGPVLLFGLLGLQTVVPIIPGHILMVGAGYLYGFWPALFFNVLTIVAVSQAAFSLVRRFGPPLARRYLPPKYMALWEQRQGRTSLTFFLCFFWFPVLPGSAMNVIAGLSSISGWRFLAASLLGRLPGIALVTLIGSHGLTLTGSQWLVAGLIGVLLLLGSHFVTRRMEAYYLKTEVPGLHS
jgi:uncharacterized membrane protein YdjX (TVP38/TMEM64 family)